MDPSPALTAPPCGLDSSRTATEELPRLPSEVCGDVEVAGAEEGNGSLPTLQSACTILSPYDQVDVADRQSDAFSLSNENSLPVLPVLRPVSSQIPQVVLPSSNTLLQPAAEQPAPTASSVHIEELTDSFSQNNPTAPFLKSNIGTSTAFTIDNSLYNNIASRIRAHLHRLEPDETTHVQNFQSFAKTSSAPALTALLNSPAILFISSTSDCILESFLRFSHSLDSITGIFLFLKFLSGLSQFSGELSLILADIEDEEDSVWGLVFKDFAATKKLRLCEEISASADGDTPSASRSEIASNIQITQYPILRWCRTQTFFLGWYRLWCWWNHATRAASALVRFSGEADRTRIQSAEVQRTAAAVKANEKEYFGLGDGRRQVGARFLRLHKLVATSSDAICLLKGFVDFVQFCVRVRKQGIKASSISQNDRYSSSERPDATPLLDPFALAFLGRGSRAIHSDRSGLFTSASAVSLPVSVSSVCWSNRESREDEASITSSSDLSTCGPEVHGTMRGSSSCGDVSADEGDNSAGYSKLRKRMQRKRDAKTKQNGANNEHASDEILIGAELKERRKVSSASRVSHRSMSRSRSRGRQTRSVVSADGNRFGVKQGHLSEQLSENQRTTIMYPAKQLHREHTSNISVVSDTTRAFDYCCDLPPLAGTGSRDSKHSIRLLADDSVASFPSFALDQNLKMADAGRESNVEVFHSSRLPNSSPPQSVRSASTVLHNHLEPAAPPSTPLPVHQQENLTRALYTWRTLLRHVFTPLYLVQVLTGARILGKFESAGKKKSFTLKRWVGIVLTLASFADVARWGHFVAKTARQMVMVMRQISLACERFSRLNNQCRLGRSASSLGMQSARSSEFGEVINTEKERLLKDTELGLDCQYGFRNFFADLIVHGIGAFKDLRIVLQNKWISRTGQQLPSTHECKQQDQQVEVVMLQHELDGLKADLQVGLLALFASVLSLPRAISGISMNDSVGSVAKSIFPSWFLGFSAATAAATCTVIPPDVVDLFA